jgi:fatty-acyl-CoA synthase
VTAPTPAFEGALEREERRGREGALPALSYADLVQLGAARFGDRDALVFEHERTTFRELANDVEAFQRRLTALGVAHGDRVGLLGTNSAEWLAAVLAIMASGAVAVPLNARDAVEGLAYTLLASDASHVLYAERYARRDMTALPGGLGERGWRGRAVTLDARARLHELVATEQAPARGSCAAPADLGIVLFTSGSTSRPKGCMLTQQGMIRNALLHTDRLGIGEDDRWFSPMPFFHAGGLVWGITSMLVSGATLVSQERFDAAGALRLIERERCTYHHGIDAMFVAEMNDPTFARERVRSLRIANSTGTGELLRRIRRDMGIEGVVSKWGLSEGYGNLTLSAPTDPLDKRLSTVGRGYPGIDYRIWDPVDGRVAATGESGEIQVRGAAMEGYYDDPESTAAMIDPDGWLCSGDLGSFDADGYLHYDGRIKEMLKVGGENVSVSEVEDTLMGHPEVRLVVVVPAAHPRLQEVPVAFVVPSTGPGAISVRELDTFARARLADFKVPVSYLLASIDDIPTTGSGKVARQSLQQQVAELVAAGDMTLERRRW